MIQQNAITSGPQPIEARHIRTRNYNTVLAILLILGVTLMLSLYVYQTSVIYATQLDIQAKQQEYARHQRLTAEALILLAQTQSMEAMTRRAQASGYGPPKAKQITYVQLHNNAKVFARKSDLTTSSRE